MSKKKLRLIVDLEPIEAAALKRLCDKISHSDVFAYLYPHVPRETRDEQAYDVMHATSHVSTALADLGVSDFPWIESRRL